MQISRRTILWAAPAVTVAGKAPAFSSSSEPPPPCKLTGKRVKKQGKKGKKGKRKTYYEYEISVACAYPVRRIRVNHKDLTYHKGKWVLESESKHDTLTVYVNYVRGHRDYDYTTVVDFR